MKASEFTNEIISELKGKKVVLFLSSSSITRFSLEDWYNCLKNSTNLTHFNNIPSNPTYEDIYSILWQYGKGNPDVVLAIGGGSAIDVAKAFTGLMYLKTKADFNKEDVLNSLLKKDYLEHEVDIPIYAVPTTAGTGSEVTSWATIWDMESKAKYSIEASWLLPERAYMVPEFTRTMSVRLTLSTGLDALCQAVEAYWAKATNPMVRVLSKAAIELIIEYLPKILKDLDNLYYRKKMSLGSLFSGLAFSNTRTTACHSISYPLTMKYGIEHGLACALTLCEVLEINLSSIDEADELLLALNVESPKELQDWIDNLTENIVRMRLSEFGIQQNHIDELVELSFTQGRMDNNPVEITPNCVRKILERIL
ncbi:MAG: phosphonoacetaldehyde reductase [Caldicoprobacterales bacterium]